MESTVYILVLALALGTLFFAIAFRDPPKIGK
ncbi:photosystem II reaction center protein T [Roseofilum casamattae]|uniref:Photosystem II reaction center protein T n=1 Tax=Roseofilum casamattae BLCC-M143 TaxID=3022442 RepID=A0ABT7BRR9_9CYAN|nr:photosystem II reaction center protein T [Roseofilum casamattae]MDJ1181888.1 photosystem II reaction center protein T [Roseofilum casamattae BLCC-M143]